MAEPANPAPIPIRTAESVQTLALLAGAEDLPPELGLVIASILRRLDDLESILRRLDDLEAHNG